MKPHLTHRNTMKIFILITVFFITTLYFWYPKFSPNLNTNELNTTKAVRFVRYSDLGPERIEIIDFNYQMEALVDKRKRDHLELLNETSYAVRNFPTQRFMVSGKAPSYNSSCASFPTLYNIKFNGNWQVMNTPNGSAFLYGAYLDNRNSTIISKESRGPVVRILGMIDYSLALDTTTSYFCQLWFKTPTKPQFSPVTQKSFHRTYENGKHRLFLFSCDLAQPKSRHDEIPESVSLAYANPCNNAKNNLRVQYEYTSEKKEFAVCVKGLDFFHEDHSTRLVEWIELLRILGADKIFLYEFAEHPNTSKVLKYYKNTDYVDITPLTLPGGLPNDPRVRHIYFGGRLNEQIAHEMIPYNDCFYRNMYKYKYIANLDPDEVIVPLMDWSWKELTTRLQIEQGDEFNISSGVCFRNTYFFSFPSSKDVWYPGIPKFMHQLQHVYRMENYSQLPLGTKCFHNTENVLITYNHFPTECFGICKTMYVNETIGHLQHYRNSCPAYMRNCLMNFEDTAVFDNNLWRFKEELIYRTVRILNHLGFVSSGSAIALNIIKSYWLMVIPSLCLLICASNCTLKI